MKKLSIGILALMLGTITLSAQESDKIESRWFHYVAPTLGTSTTQPGGKVGLKYAAMQHYDTTPVPAVLAWGIEGSISSFVKPQSSIYDNITTDINLVGRTGIGEWSDEIGLHVYMETKFGLGYDFGYNDLYMKMYLGLGEDFRISRNLGCFFHVGTYFLNYYSSKWGGIPDCFKGGTDPRPFGVDLSIGLMF